MIPILHQEEFCVLEMMEMNIWTMEIELLEFKTSGYHSELSVKAKKGMEIKETEAEEKIWSGQIWP